MRGAWFGIVGIGVFLLPAQANSRPLPGPWSPTGTWTIQNRPVCSAFRSYASLNQQVIVSIQPDPTGEYVWIQLEVPSEIYGYGLTLAKAKIGRNQLKNVHTMRVAPSTNRGKLLYTMTVLRADLSPLSSGEELSIATRSMSVKLPISDFRQTLDSLKPCVSQLLADWGLSREDQARLASFPVPKFVPGTEITDDDYPTEALKAGRLGDVIGRITVAEDGSASDCVVLRSSGHSALDNTTCNLMLRRRKFEPAHTQDQRTIRSPVFFSFRWQMEY